MSANDRIILDEILQHRRLERDPNASESDFFEFFSAEQLFKDFDLSDEQIEEGLVGGGQDGGIDGIYLFVNGELILEKPDLASLRGTPLIELIMIQSKRSGGFEETPIERFLTASEDILDLSKRIEDIRETYNAPLAEAIERFREIHQQLSHKFPNLHVRYCYTSRSTVEPNEPTKRKVEKLQQVVNRHFPSAKFSFEFVGASRLLELTRKEPQTVYHLSLAENPISSSGREGFVCLVQLSDFFHFITDENGTLRRTIFESNVRDYQGRTEVNDEIQNSLRERYPEDFWWLNNGITIIASKSSQSSKALTIEDPQIVNGLQTSTEIFRFFQNSDAQSDDRNILVRVIVPSEMAIRSRVIKATNSQTAIQPATLRATDKIHLDIEEYLIPRGLFYDRRKNYYKNEGKPRDVIIGIPHLAQAVMAIVLQRPDTARARPSSLLKRDEDYHKVFSTNHPVKLYHICAALMKSVESFLKKSTTLSASERNNLRFYIAMRASQLASNSSRPSIAQICDIDTLQINQQLLEEALKQVESDYTDLGGNDQVAKGAALRERLSQSFKPI